MTKGLSCDTSIVKINVYRHLAEEPPRTKGHSLATCHPTGPKRESLSRKTTFKITAATAKVAACWSQCRVQGARQGPSKSCSLSMHFDAFHMSLVQSLVVTSDATG